MSRFCNVVALVLATCLSLSWDQTRRNPGWRSGASATCKAVSRDSSELAAESGRERSSLEAIDRSNQRPRKRPRRTGFQEHSNPVAENSSGRAVSSHHERGIQPRPRCELHALPRRGGLLERRQTAEARRPRDGKDAPRDQRATGKNGEPRSAGERTFDQLRHLSSRRGQSAGGGPLAVRGASRTSDRHHRPGTRRSGTCFAYFR